MTTEVYGNLTVLERVQDHVTPKGYRMAKVLCRCSCGTEIEAYLQSLRKGRTVSCGCGRFTDRPTYSGAHQRIRATKGKASEQRCVDCGGQAQDWSYDGLDPDELTETRNGYSVGYSTKSEHYLARCRVCHRREDRSTDPRVPEVAWPRAC